MPTPRPIKMKSAVLPLTNLEIVELMLYKFIKLIMLAGTTLLCSILIYFLRGHDVQSINLLDYPLWTTWAILLCFYVMARAANCHLTLFFRNEDQLSKRWQESRLPLRRLVANGDDIDWYRHHARVAQARRTHRPRHASVTDHHTNFPDDAA